MKIRDLQYENKYWLNNNTSMPIINSAKHNHTNSKSQTATQAESTWLYVNLQCVQPHYKQLIRAADAHLDGRALSHSQTLCLHGFNHNLYNTCKTKIYICSESGPSTWVSCVSISFGFSAGVRGAGFSAAFSIGLPDLSFLMESTMLMHDTFKLAPHTQCLSHSSCWSSKQILLQWVIDTHHELTNNAQNTTQYDATKYQNIFWKNKVRSIQKNVYFSILYYFQIWKIAQKSTFY